MRDLAAGHAAAAVGLPGLLCPVSAPHPGQEMHFVGISSGARSLLRGLTDSHGLLSPAEPQTSAGRGTAGCVLIGLFSEAECLAAFK